MKKTGWEHIVFRVINLLLIAFLLLPIGIVLLFAFNSAAFIIFPPEGFSLRWFHSFFTHREFMRSFWLSLQLAATTVVISTLIGTMAAIAIVRGKIPGAGFLSALFLSPLMLPAILTGLALFQFYVILDVGRTYTGLLIGHIVVTIPYVIRTVSALLHNFDRSVEEAAQNLGAGEVATFWHITLPLIRPGVIAGSVFAFIVSFDQFAVSLFLVQPGINTLPIQLFNYLKYSFDPTVAAAATVSIALSVTVVLLLERTIGLQEYVKL
jgi:putative spermidine/putrescine transport system permease protein